MPAFNFSAAAPPNLCLLTHLSKRNANCSVRCVLLLKRRALAPMPLNAVERAASRNISRAAAGATVAQSLSGEIRVLPAISVCKARSSTRTPVHEG